MNSSSAEQTQELVIEDDRKLKAEKPEDVPAELARDVSSAVRYRNRTGDAHGGGPSVNCVKEPCSP